MDSDSYTVYSVCLFPQKHCISELCIKCILVLCVFHKFMQKIYSDSFFSLYLIRPLLPLTWWRELGENNCADKSTLALCCTATRLFLYGVQWWWGSGGAGCNVLTPSWFPALQLDYAAFLSLRQTVNLCPIAIGNVKDI